MLEMMPVLAGKDLNKEYKSPGRTVRPLQHVDFELYPGEILGIVGESGSGKSTLLRVISGIEKPDSGQLFHNGVEYTGLRPEKIGKFLQMIFQDAYGSFDPKMTMEKSLREGIKNRDKDDVNTENPFTDKTGNTDARGSIVNRNDEELHRILREVGLSEELLSRRPRSLSGGQCQRMSIARALLMHAGVLLCDEITSALDVTTQAQVIRLLTEVRDNEGVAIMMVSHDMALVSMVCDRIMVMKDGVAVEQGKTAKVISDPSHPYTKSLLSSVLSV